MKQNQETSILLELDDISKNYGKLKIIQNFSLKIHQGQKIAILGPSGCGKTTLLNLMGLLDRVDEGSIIFHTEKQSFEYKKISRRQEDMIRRQYFGFIFQIPFMLKSFDITDNISLPLLLQGKNTGERKKYATEMIESLFRIEKDKSGDEEHVMGKTTNKLSGGQLQRIAIGRALIHNPKIVFADEPTGSLDPKTSKKVIDHLFDKLKQTHSALLLVTHDESLAKRCDDIIRLRH